MGSASRTKPKYQAKKLLSIREQLNLSQGELAEKLSDSEIKVLRSDISRYERGLREPSNIILMRYARAAGATMEALTDDKMELPD